MKKFTELMTSMTVESEVKPAFNIATSVIHLARNPVVGGSPLSLARIRIILQGESVCPLSLSMFILFDFNKAVIAVITLVQ